MFLQLTDCMTANKLYMALCSIFVDFSKSEFVIHKLKEMGRIDEKEILSICNQFNKIDLHNTGKITLPDLLSVSR